ncbi:MAG: hypothetical protein AAFR61_02420 [Bacteroidota bacterium]
MKPSLLWLGLLLSLFPANLQAQSGSENYPLRITLMDESVSLPSFQALTYSFHPAIMIGTEKKLNQHPIHQWILSANLGFYHHATSQSALFLLPEIGYRYEPGKWYASARFGLGYSHAFYFGPEFRYEGGEIAPVSGYGQGALIPSLALETGYRWKDKANSPAVYLLWMNNLEVPFHIYTPVHQFVGLGLSFYPFTPKS